MGTSNRWKADMLKTLLGGATIKALLVTSGYAFDPDHSIVDDVVPASNEMTGTGYSRLTLSGLAVTQDDANDRATFTFDDLVWSSASFDDDVAGCWLFEFVTDDSDSPLRRFYALSATTDGGDFTLRANSDGDLAVQAG